VVGKLLCTRILGYVTDRTSVGLRWARNWWRRTHVLVTSPTLAMKFTSAPQPMSRRATFSLP